MAKALTKKKYKLQKFPGKGGWTFAAIPEIPQDQHNPFGWVRVKGTIDGVSITNYHLMPMGNGQLFLPVKAALRKQLQKKEGDWITVELYADDGLVVIPEELLLCLQDEPLALKRFYALKENEQINTIKEIFDAKKAATRAEKIETLIRRMLNQ